MTDGYGPGENDGFHFVKFLGSLLSGFVGVVLLSMMSSSSDDTALWLFLIGGGLVLVSLAAAWFSGFYRRYHFLIWWKKLIILIPTWLGFMAVIFVQQLLIYLFGGSGGGAGGGSGRGANEAVDEDGNVFRWNSWSGTWEPKAGFLGLGQERGAVQYGLLGRNTKRGMFGAAQHGSDGRELYERRD